MQPLLNFLPINMLDLQWLGNLIGNLVKLNCISIEQTNKQLEKKESDLYLGLCFLKYHKNITLAHFKFRTILSNVIPYVRYI